MLLGIGQYVQAALGALRGGRDEIAGHAVLDLQWDSADVAADDRPLECLASGHDDLSGLAGGNVLLGLRDL